MSEYWEIKDEWQLANFCEVVRAAHKDGKAFKCEVVRDARSKRQNAALHRFCTMLAEALNEKHLDMKVMLAHHPEIQWTPQGVKDYLWRPIQKAMTGEDSTTKPSTKDYPAIYDQLNAFLIERYSINVPWPNREDIGRMEYPEAGNG